MPLDKHQIPGNKNQNRNRNRQNQSPLFHEKLLPARARIFLNETDTRIDL
jgi:hypothetical protein